MALRGAVRLRLASARGGAGIQRHDSTRRAFSPPCARRCKARHSAAAAVCHLAPRARGGARPLHFFTLRSGCPGDRKTDCAPRNPAAGDEGGAAREVTDGACGAPEGTLTVMGRDCPSPASPVVRPARQAAIRAVAQATSAEAWGNPLSPASRRAGLSNRPPPAAARSPSSRSAPPRGPARRPPGAPPGRDRRSGAAPRRRRSRRDRR
jgi:hypothetical protein